MSNKIQQKTIILDFGSGETCRNEPSVVKEMIDELANIKYNREFFRVVVKWQLFHKAPPFYPWPLSPGVFYYAYNYAKDKGFEITASVFNLDTLEGLLRFDIPFVKLACRDNLYQLINFIPDGTQAIVSFDSIGKYKEIQQQHNRKITPLFCIPQYPADPIEYQTTFSGHLSYSISDHSPTTDLFVEYQPIYYERHYKLNNSVGLDAGPFASTPKQIEEMLRLVENSYDDGK